MALAICIKTLYHQHQILKIFCNLLTAKVKDLVGSHKIEHSLQKWEECIGWDCIALDLFHDQNIFSIKLS